MLEYPTSVLWAALLRLASAFAFYLALYPLWILSGLREAYISLVLRAATLINLEIQHFPVVSSLLGLEINSDSVIVLAFSLILFAPSLSWPLRGIAFFLSGVSLFLVHISAVLLHSMVASSQMMLESKRVYLLLPWEFLVIERCKYFLYEFSLQLAPFVLMALALAWYVRRASGRSDVAGKRKHGATRYRARDLRLPRLLISSTAFCLSISIVLLVISIGYIWIAVRENDPRHLRAHIAIGQILQAKGNAEEAERHFQAASVGGVSDPPVLHRALSRSK